MGTAAFIQKREYPDQALVKKINEGDKTAFEQLFFTYYSDLCRMALSIVKNDSAAEDVVQNVFLNIWKNRKQWTINISLKAYLYRSVKNRAINYNKKQRNHRQTREKYLEIVKYSVSQTAEVKSEGDQQTVTKIWNAAETLPKRRRFVFTLHRKYGLTYKEISEVMGITPKTVENHMGLALKQLRKLID